MSWRRVVHGLLLSAAVLLAGCGPSIDDTPADPDQLNTEKQEAAQEETEEAGRK